MSVAEVRAALREFADNLGAEALSSGAHTVDGVRAELFEALRMTASSHGDAAVTDASGAVDLISSAQEKLLTAANLLAGYAASI